MRLFIRCFLLSLLYVTATRPAWAQEDAYHSGLKTQLEQQYGVTGGTWTFGTQEASVLGLANPSSGVKVENAPVSGQSFSRALRLTVMQPTGNAWERTIRFPIQQPMQAGDAMLLVMWLRHTWPADEEGRVEPVFEMAASPYTKSLSEAYGVPGEWTLYLLPFGAALDHAAGAARFQLNMGQQRQMIELGGLALINYGQAYTVDQLPEVTPAQTYGGRSPDAPWRAAAQARIETHRQGTFRVVVQDTEGRPVPEAAVHVAMQQHAFGFGTAVAAGNLMVGGLNPTYRTKLGNLTGDGRSFNLAVLENALKWPPWESNWPGTKQEKVAVVQWLRDRGMAVRGHNLLWPRWDNLPDDLEANQNDPAYLRDRIHDHILEQAGYPGLKGVLREWDVVNEPVHETDLQEALAGTPGYPTGEEILTEAFQWAAEADPDARLFINEYSILSTYGPVSTTRPAYKRLIQQLIDAGVRLDGIGMQGHMGTPLTPIDTVYKVLDEFAAFGRGLSITEYDASGVEEQLAADYLRDFLTVVFSHPAVESFLMWGFWDGAHWFDDAPIFRQDWSLKPSGEAFIDLVFDQWWTNVEAVTDDAGAWEGRGFLGDYEITAAIGGQLVRREVTLTAGDTVEVVLTVTPTARETPEAPAFRVDPNYPDPFGAATALDFVLPAPAEVVLEVFDVVGRRVDRQDLGFRPAGPHTVTLPADGWPAGVYFYRLRAGEHLHTGRMLRVP